MLFEFLLECLYVWIVAGNEHADTAHALRLLGAAPRAGHATVPPINVMNSRRLMVAPKAEQRNTRQTKRSRMDRT